MSKKEEIQNQMMDYLYDEMDDQEKETFEALMREQPVLQKELNELREMSGMLSSTPSVVPEYKPAFLISKETDEMAQQRQGFEEQARLSPGSEEQAQQRQGFEEQAQHRRGSEKQGKVKSLLNPVMKTLLAIAASLLLILFGSSLAGVEMGQTEEGFYLTFGNPPIQTESGISEDQVLELIEQIQIDQTLLLTSLMEEGQRQQNDKLNEMIFVLADYYDDRRQQDLMMFADGLEQLEIQTHHRFNRTNEALGDLIYAISNP